MRTSLLTVIGPVYNRTKYIDRCVTSILSQTFRNLHLIIVDDGSESNCAKFCDEFAKQDGRVRVIHISHGGPIRARRIGVSESETEYVTFVDSDDYIELDTYEELAVYMEKHIELIHFGMLHDDSNGITTVSAINFKSGEYDRQRIESEIFPTLLWNVEKDEKGINVSLCDKIIKRELLFERYKDAGDLKFHYHEDSVISIPIFSKIKSMVIIDKPYYHHCHDGGNIGKYMKEKAFFDNLYDWYCCLRNKIDFMPDGQKQLEYAYINAVETRKWAYNDRREHVGHVFPFEKVKNGSKIVIWGYGNVGKTYQLQIDKTSYCEIVAICDRNWELYADKGVVAPEQIMNLDYDAIVIAVDGAQYQEAIRNEVEKMMLRTEVIVA